MGNPLEELREINRRVEQKKNETEKNIVQRQKQERERMSKETLELQQERMRNAARTNKYTRNIKLAVVTTSFIILAVLVFFITRYIIFSGSSELKNVQLISDSFTELDAAAPEYLTVSKFISALTSACKKSASIPDKFFYNGLSDNTKSEYSNILKEKFSLDTLSCSKITFRTEIETFNVLLDNADGTEKVYLRLVYGNNGELKITKVY